MTPLSIVQGILDRIRDRNEGLSLRGVLYVRPEPKKEFTLEDAVLAPVNKYGHGKAPVYNNTFEVNYTPGKKNLEYEYQKGLIRCVSGAFLSPAQEERAEYGIFTDLGNCIVPGVDLENGITYDQARQAVDKTLKLYKEIMWREGEAPPYAETHLFHTGNSYHIYLGSGLKNKDTMAADWYNGLNSEVPYVDRRWTQMLVNTKGKSGILRLSAGQNNRKVPVYIPT